MAEHGGKLSDNYELVNNAIRDFHQIQTDAHRHLAKESDRDAYEWEQRSIHDLRRTFGSMMAQPPAPKLTIRRVFGSKFADDNRRMERTVQFRAIIASVSGK